MGKLHTGQPFCPAPSGPVKPGRQPKHPAPPAIIELSQPQAKPAAVDRWSEVPVLRIDHAGSLLCCFDFIGILLYFRRYLKRIHRKTITKSNKKRQSVDCLSVLALPIFPGRRQPSIVGRNELNYRVRNGNGWTLALISTNFIVAKSA